MQLEIARKSLEGSLSIINSFYRNEKLDSPHSVILKAGDNGAYIHIDTPVSSITIPLIVNNTNVGIIAIAIDELQTALAVVSSDPFLTFNLADSIITISDSQGKMQVNEAVFDTPDKTAWNPVPVLKTSLHILTPTLKRALNYLPGSNNDYNALYIVDTENGMRGLVLEDYRFLVMDLDSIVLENPIVKIPARIINALNTLTNLDKMNLPITLAEDYKPEVEGPNRYVELQIFGEHQSFRFGMLDKYQPPENIHKAKIIDQLIELPLRVEVDRENAISAFAQLQKLVAKDENDFVGVTINSMGLEMVAAPKSMTGIFNKKLPAINSEFDLDTVVKFHINPKQVVDALKCFSDDTVYFKVSTVETSPLGISSPYDDTVNTYIARTEV